MNPFKLGLKQVLEDSSVIKIFHDFCEDTSALIRQYEVIADGVFDT
jgi:ribonuclease D